jgi:hypothetical protein
MQSSIEAGVSPTTRARSMSSVMSAWNRKIHFYLGLYLLLFLWLFAFTGLLLNHPRWTFAEFWPNRHQSSFEAPIQPPPARGDLIQARDIMRQVGVHGEIEWTRSRSDTSRLDFRASRPGHIYEIKANLQQGRATIQRIDLNAWGVVHILHTFTGVRLSDSKNQRDWSITTLWVLCMDALAIGLILMVVSSIYMWWSQKQKRWLGLLALSSGLLTCGLFVIGLRWLV